MNEKKLERFSKAVTFILAMEVTTSLKAEVKKTFKGKLYFKYENIICDKELYVSEFVKTFSQFAKEFIMEHYRYFCIYISNQKPAAVHKASLEAFEKLLIS